MSDLFASQGTALDSPATRAVAVTPSDGADLATFARALYIGGEGDVSCVTVGGDTVIFTAVAGGSILPVRVSRVRATGTTATGIVAVW